MSWFLTIPKLAPSSGFSLLNVVGSHRVDKGKSHIVILDSFRSFKTLPSAPQQSSQRYFQSIMRLWHVLLLPLLPLWRKPTPPHLPVLLWGPPADLVFVLASLMTAVDFVANTNDAIRLCSEASHGSLSRSDVYRGRHQQLAHTLCPHGCHIPSHPQMSTWPAPFLTASQLRWHFLREAFSDHATQRIISLSLCFLVLLYFSS